MFIIIVAYVYTDRAGSEFWMQQERIGDEETGILYVIKNTIAKLFPVNE